MTSIVSAITGSGSMKAAGAQAGAAEAAYRTSEEAMAAQLQMTKEAMAQQQDMLDQALAIGEPFVQAGSNAMAMYESMLYGVPMEKTPTYRTVQYQQQLKAEKEQSLKTLPEGLTPNGSNMYIGGGRHYRVNPDGTIESYRAESNETWMPYRPEFTPSEPPPDIFIDQADMGTVNPMDAVKQTPGYQFRMDEGQKALERSAAARSGILSGAQIKATERYGQDYATGEFDKFLGRLSQVINTGAAAAGAQQQGILSTAGTQAGLAGANMQAVGNQYANMGNAQMQVGAAKASGYLGQQAAGTNTINALAGMAGSYFGGGFGGGTPAPETIRWNQGGTSILG